MQCNQIELKSPAGTKSILIHAANGFANAAVNSARVLSNAFYGEPVNGTWTLTFYDFCAASGTSTQLSTTAPQTLLIVGH
jgi:subtilisin-like proprotein convertase family protein